jgi:Zn-dependent peptidase ImmA (M78 family)
MSTLRGKERAIIRAKRLRLEFSLEGPRVDVEAIANGLGIVVKRDKKVLEEEGLSGLVKRSSEEGKGLILLNDKTNKLRQRFTIAHEIGHFLLHASDDIHVDEARVYFRGNATSRDFDLKETEANYFAAELLMPTEWIVNDLKQEERFSDDMVERYAKRYEVSISAMSVKLSSLLNFMG